MAAPFCVDYSIVIYRVISNESVGDGFPVPLARSCILVEGEAKRLPYNAL